jgi:transposase
MSVSNTTKRVKEIRRNTRRKFSSEEKIRIVLDGLRGESSIAELYCREGINRNLYYRWSKGFLEAGNQWRLFSLLRIAAFGRFESFDSLKIVSDR